MKKIIILLLFISAFSIQAQQENSQHSVVVVKGEGIVKVVPDQVLLRSRIEHEGDNARDVKKQNDAVVAKILSYLKSRGIEEKNFRTEYMNLNKNYNYNDKSFSYVANQAISIKLENLNNYEEIMSGLLDAGLNRIDGIEFQSSKKEEHASAARKKAVENAKMKAEEYAAALGQTIGKAVNISEAEANNYQPVYRMEMMESSVDGGVEETMAPGEMEVTARVTVSFALD